MLRELLWDGNPAFWNGRAPLLFPIVGTLAGGIYRVADKTYALSRHGFARGKPFEVVSTSQTAYHQLFLAVFCHFQLWAPVDLLAKSEIRP